jgi:hypothetical protein
MRKISFGGFKLFITGVGIAASYQAYHYYKDATRDDAKTRADEISHSTLHKQYDSVRVKDVELIRRQLTLKPNEIQNKFSVLIGPRGIGKTVAIESAAENLNGIISFI